MKVYTEYTVELDWQSMTEIIEKHDLGYNEYALKEMTIWCEFSFGNNDERWRRYSRSWPNNDIFSFRNEADRTLFILKWL